MREAVTDEIVVVKRSGQRVPFNGTKIALAIKKGFDSVYDEYDEKIVNKVYEKVLNTINKDYQERKTIGIEDIQTIIENTLKKTDEKVYESFASYRERRAASRKAFDVKQQHKFAKAIERIINSTKETFNNKPNEILLDFGKTIAAEYTKTYILDNKLARAHEEGSIYIHNLDYFNLGKISSTHLIFDNVLDEFPNKFITEALNAKSEVDGEIAIDSIDYLLEDLLVNKFKKILKKLLKKYLSINGYFEYINFKKVDEIIDKEQGINFEIDLFELLIYNKQVKEIFELSYNDTMKYILELFEEDFQKILKSLNNNYNENKRYVISIGANNSFEGLMINKCYLKVLSLINKTENVTTIFKVKKDSNSELLNKVSELVLEDKNIAFAFVDNSYNTYGNNSVEYFSDGKRIFENSVYDCKDSRGRMITSSVSLNLGRLGLKYMNENISDFYNELDDLLELVKNALILVFETIGDKNRDNYQVIFNHNIIDDDKLEEHQKIRKVIKKGVLNIELAGIYECAMSLESDEEKRQKTIIDIIEHVYLKSKKYTKEYNLNFIVSETNKYRPLRKLMELDKAIYGIKKGVTDKNFYGRIDNMTKNNNDINSFLDFMGKCQTKLSGGCLTNIYISKTTGVKKIIEYLNLALEKDVGFIRFNIRK